MALAVLADRAVVEVGGEEARSFLQRLVTNDVDRLGAGETRYAALLTPQGKVITDFLILALPGQEVFWLDMPAVAAAELVKRLTVYRLRAKVTVADRSAELGIVAFTGPPPLTLLQAYDDPRDPGLWRRGIAGRAGLADLAARSDPAAYHDRRIRSGVPESGLDYGFGDAFPHEANLDRLHGIDFRKGCYVGQEVVSRVEHRGTARKRIVKARFEGTPPPIGTDITAGGVVIGTMGSSTAGHGLAAVRVDRAGEAAGPFEAGVTLELDWPAWVTR